MRLSMTMDADVKAVQEMVARHARPKSFNRDSGVSLPAWRFWMKLRPQAPRSASVPDCFRKTINTEPATEEMAVLLGTAAAWPPTGAGRGALRGRLCVPLAGRVMPEVDAN